MTPYQEGYAEGLRAGRADAARLLGQVEDVRRAIHDAGPPQLHRKDQL